MSKNNTKKELELIKKSETIDILRPEKRIKYEIAEELGLAEQVMEKGWGSLSAKETGKIGGLITKRKKEKRKQQE